AVSEAIRSPKTCVRRIGDRSRTGIEIYQRPVRGLAVDRECDRVVVRIAAGKREIRGRTKKEVQALIGNFRSPIEQTADVAFLIERDHHSPAEQGASILHIAIRDSQAPRPLNQLAVKRS